MPFAAIVAIGRNLQTVKFIRKGANGAEAFGPQVANNDMHVIRKGLSAALIDG